VSDSPEPSWTASRELENLVQRVVAESVEPLRAELATMGRNLATMAARLPQPELTDEVTGRFDAIVARIDGARVAESESIERFTAQIETARRTEGANLLRQMTTLAEAIADDSDLRRTQADDLRTALARSLEQAIAEAELLRTADTTRILDQVGTLAARADADDRRRAEETRALLAAVDERLLNLHATGTTADDASQARLALASLERSIAPLAALPGQVDEMSVTLATAIQAAVAHNGIARSEQVDGLGHRIAEAMAQIEITRTADNDRVLAEIVALEGPLERDRIDREARFDDIRHAVTDLEQTLNKLGAVGAADTARVLEQVTALAAWAEADDPRRTEQTIALLDGVEERLLNLHATGAAASGASESRLTTHMEAVAARHAQELTDRIDERTAAMVELGGRAAAEIHDATAACLAGQVEPVVAGLIEAIDTLAHEGGRVEALARGHVGELRAVEERVAAMFAEIAVQTDGAVASASRQIHEEMAEVRSALLAAGLVPAASQGQADNQINALGASLETVLAAVEAIGRDPRLEVLAAEQVAARQAQLDAVEALSGQIAEVGPVVARALLSEVERASRSANAAEEAVARLRPDTLRAVLNEAAEHAAVEVHAAAQRLDEAILALSDAQTGIRSQLAELATRTLERPAAVTDEVAQASETAIDDLRASQRALREAVQDGAHKAELAAIDIRGLRDRLAPHLVALADATTRRAEADQAGFDAVLTRLDQLLVGREH